ncbi:uncharacterized protein LOC129920084 [Episyrphus balteatus]|uniref:uncharacterized protein LOC129920084 n=1 Tax=Episyrphus balteatus TaxID=286459 RepID=UPI002486CD6A|nr:uncharacterized protein LOC129920084 [Episyrphus balteatus]
MSKFLIVVVLVAICGSSLAGKEEWKQNAEQCSATHNVKWDDMKNIKEADNMTADMKCFFLCMAEKQKIIKDGAFQPQVFAENAGSSADKDKVTKITTECNLKGTDNCDTAAKVMACIGKNIMHKM